MTTSDEPVAAVSSQTSHSAAAQEVAASGNCVNRWRLDGDGLISSVTASPLLVTSTTALSTAALSIDPQLSSTRPALTSSCVLVSNTGTTASSVSTGTPAGSVSTGTPASNVSTGTTASSVSTGTPAGNVSTGTTASSVSTGTPASSVSTGTPAGSVSTGTSASSVSTGTTVVVTSVLETCLVNSGQTSSDVAQDAVLTASIRQRSAAESATLHDILRSTEDAHLPVNADVTATTRNSAAAIVSDEARVTGPPVNASQTVTIRDAEGQQTSSEQGEADSAADAATDAKDDSCVRPTLSEQGQLIADGVSCDVSVTDSAGGSDSQLPGIVDSAGGSDSQLPGMVDSSDSATCETLVNKDDVDRDGTQQTIQEPAMTASCHKGDADDTGDGSREKTTAEANDTGSSTIEGQSQAGISRDKDDASHIERVEEMKQAADSSLKEQQLRQIMTLPADLLAQLNTSRPVLLSFKHEHHHEIVVPAAHIYQSTCGLRLLVPADTLPAECVNSKQLACTVKHCDDETQSQLITVSLALNSRRR